MARNDRKPSGRPRARAAAQYTIYNVNEPAELMEFLMKKMAGISRTRVKALLSNRVVLVDNNIQTQYNYPLKPGMKVQISKEKNKHEFRHPLLKILYEDAYLIVVEKKEGLLSVATDKQKERTAQHILNEYVKRQHRNNRVFVVHRLDRETSGIMPKTKRPSTLYATTGTISCVTAAMCQSLWETWKKIKAPYNHGLPTVNCMSALLL